MLGRDGCIGRRQEGMDHAWEKRDFCLWVECKVRIDDKGLAKSG